MFTSQTAKLAKQKAIANYERKNEVAYNRSIVFKEFFTMNPDFFKNCSADFQTAFEKKWGNNMDDKTVLEIITANVVMALMLKPDPKLLEFMFTNVYGKAKEESEIDLMLSDEFILEKSNRKFKEEL